MTLSPRVVVAGGTGLLGRALSDHLAARGHDVIVLTRQPSSATVDPLHADAAHPGVRLVHWTPDAATAAWAGFLDGAAAVVNLAGASIAEKRWTSAQKKRLVASRIEPTQALVSAMAAVEKKPDVFVSGSAVGYYGLRGDERLTEASPPGEDFLAQLSVEWEDAAREAAAHARLVVLRTGVVLDREGGALPRMIAPFKLLAGGPLGSGRQYISWIHIEDWVEMASWAIADARVNGPINVTAPNPVTNREFAQEIGRVLHRPALVSAPGFALRALLGEMADPLLLGGQRVMPERARQLGFRFRFPQIGDALRAVLRPQIHAD